MTLLILKCMQFLFNKSAYSFSSLIFYIISEVHGLMQLSAGIPFKTDIAFVSGTGLKDSRVKERVNSLTGFLQYLFHLNN